MTNTKRTPGSIPFVRVTKADGTPASAQEIFSAMANGTPVRFQAPEVAILDEGGHLAVVVDRHDGRGSQLSATYAQGFGSYPEAQERARAEAMAKAEARRAEILKPYTS